MMKNDSVKEVTQSLVKEVLGQENIRFSYFLNKFDSLDSDTTCQTVYSQTLCFFSSRIIRFQVVTLSFSKTLKTSSCQSCL